MKRRGFLKSLAGMLAVPFVAALPVKASERAYGIEDYPQYHNKVKMNISVPLDSLPPETLRELSRQIGIIDIEKALTLPRMRETANEFAGKTASSIEAENFLKRYNKAFNQET